MPRVSLQAVMVFALAVAGSLSGCSDPAGSPPGVEAPEAAQRTAVSVDPGERREPPRVERASHPSHPGGELGDVQLASEPGHDERPVR